jgi:hypothetical protein
MNAISPEERKLHFSDALQALNKITNSTCSFEAYRAGGWCIQPFNVFNPLFGKFNITSDFSVLGGSKRQGNTLSFDFSSIAPNSKPYRFEHKVNVGSKTGSYKEYPISSIPINKKSLLNKLINKILWRLPYGQNMGDGISSPFKSDKPASEFDIIFEMVSIELFNLNKLNKYKAFLKENDYMQFISHPKMISEHNLKTLSHFLKSVSNKYKVVSDWKKVKV